MNWDMVCGESVCSGGYRDGREIQQRRECLAGGDGIVVGGQPLMHEDTETGGSESRGCERMQQGVLKTAAGEHDGAGSGLARHVHRRLRQTAMKRRSKHGRLCASPEQCFDGRLPVEIEPGSRSPRGDKGKGQSAIAGRSECRCGLDGEGQLAFESIAHAESEQRPDAVEQPAGA